MPECYARAFQKRLLAARGAQRTGTDNADVAGMHVTQPLAEALKAGQRSRRYFTIQSPVIVNASSQSHRLAQAIDNDQLTVTITGDDQVKAIRTQIDRCEDPGIGARRAWHSRQYRWLPTHYWAAVNDEPQPQVVTALGLRITNCAPSSPSR